MTGLIVCSVIAGFALGALGVAVVYLKGFIRGYEKAQTDLTVELYALVEDLKQPLDHIDHQRIAGKAGLQ